MVHQSSLCYNDLTLHHFVVSSTSVEHLRVSNWKSMCMVLCCCVQYVEIYTEQRIFADSIFCFLWRNYCRNISITPRSLWWTCSIARYVWTMVSAFQKWWLRHKTRKKVKKFKNMQRWTRIIRKHKNNSPSNWVSQQAVHNRQREMWKIQNNGRWVPSELNDRQMEKNKNTCDILLSGYKRKSYLHPITLRWQGMKNGFILRIPSAKKSWVNPGASSTSTAKPNGFDKKTMLCVW